MIYKWKILIFVITGSMFGSFFQAEIMKRNKKIAVKRLEYQPFHIPVQEINSEKPITQMITQQCQKLKSKFEFLKQEIARENSKKRTKLSPNFVNPLKTADLMRRNCLSNSTSKLNCKTEKDPPQKVHLNLKSIIKTSNGGDSNSVRCMLRAISKQKQIQNKLSHIF